MRRFRTTWFVYVVMAIAGLLMPRMVCAALPESFPVCDQEPSPAEVAVQIQAPQTLYLQDKTKQELTALMAMHEPDIFAGGVTQTHISTRLDASFYYSQSPQQAGHICMAVRSVDVTLGREMTVHVAKEFENGCCQYWRTMAHEKRHVDVENEMLNAMQAYLLSKLKHEVAAMKPLRGISVADAERAKALFAERIKEVIAEAQARMDAARQMRHGAIDQYEAYKTLTDDCGTDKF